MSEHDYQKLAKQFLDMWQDQTRNTLQDKEFLEALLSMLQGNKTPNPFEGFSSLYSQGNAYANASSPDANATDALHDELAAIHERLRSCEARLQALESEKPVSRRKQVHATGNARRAGTKTGSSGSRRSTKKTD